MCCRSMFSPEKIGTIVYACGCSWFGSQPKWTLDTNIKDPLITSTVKGQLAIMRAESDPFVAVCPDCGHNGVDGTLLLDVGLGSKYVTKTNDDGSTWNKEIRTDVVELRMANDVRRISSFTWSNWGFGIFWEVARAIDPEFPKKPKMRDFESKKEFFKAHKKFKDDRRRHLNTRYTIADLYKAIKSNLVADLAKERTRALVKAIFGSLDVKMTKQFKLGDVWSLAINRSKSADKMISHMSKRTDIDTLLHAAGYNPKYTDLVNILIRLRREFGNIGIRPSVVKAILNKPFGGMWVVRGAGYVPYDKSTRKYADFIEEHKEDFFENPMYSMDRGKEVIDHENGVVVTYDTDEDEMVETRELDEYQAPVSYREWSSDDYESYELEDKKYVDPTGTATTADYNGSLGSYHEWKFINDEQYIENRRSRPEPVEVEAI